MSGLLVAIYAMLLAMHYQVLARKWRPQKFDELIGQPHIVRTLRNSLLQKRIAQAYLLAGTRGVGKTTVARIFAKAIRCENLSKDANPCGECRSCTDTSTQAAMDIIEIDGASHNGVESIRSLIDNVQYLPTSGDYKVYIIDEVHMLSVSAFNALLKTLEEPPAHVIFVFATTDPDKLLKTVLSRCQRLDFRNVQENDLIDHISNIANSEKITFENENLIKELASLGRGSVRDTLSLLDQLLSMSEKNSITEEVFSLALGVAKTSQVKSIVDALIEENPEQVYQVYKDVFQNNVDLKSFCAQVSNELFELTQNSSARAGKSIEKDESFWIFEAFNKETAWALDSLHPKEVVLVVFQKIANRGEFFHRAKKKRTETEKSVEVTVFSWEGFVSHVENNSLAIAQNLKRAILKNEKTVIAGGKKLELIYNYTDEVLFNVAKEGQASLLELLQDFMQNKEYSIEMQIMAAGEKKEVQTQSLEEKEETQRKETRDQREKNIRDNQFIKEAQNLFDAKVDKIIIKDKI